MFFIKDYVKTFTQLSVLLFYKFVQKKIKNYLKYFLSYEILFFLAYMLSQNYQKLNIFVNFWKNSVRKFFFLCYKIF